MPFGKGGKSLRVKLFSSGEDGFTYMTLLLAVVIIGIALSAVGRQWSLIDRRDKENELLFRGDQFVIAIDAYFKSAHGGANIYPKTLEDLLKDSRSLVVKRYLRRMYEDPVTGKADWIPIKEAKSGRIKGVRSSSSMAPVKTDGFPARYSHFKGKATYGEWDFVHKAGML